jgi:hypothetical protein
MKVLNEGKVVEAVKPMGFVVEFVNKGSGLYQIYIDGHKFGKDLFDEDDVNKFIKLKLEFLKRLEALVV